MHKSMALLGSTGSIGRQTLEVVRALKGVLRLDALVAHSNVELLASQAKEFLPSLVVCVDDRAYPRLKDLLSGIPVDVMAGHEGLCAAVTMESTDLVLSAVVGSAGLRPALLALQTGKDLALANKETLVTGGRLVVDAARASGAAILPVDSEHSAVFQCLQGQPAEAVRRILLTASGGPFRGSSTAELADATLEMALRHPKWSMGPKITVDCATLMNKGLEVIEARWLFGLDYSSIDVVVHPESIVHSMVELIDGSVLAQLGVADMRLPIQYAVSYPDRASAVVEHLDLVRAGSLTFTDPDPGVFPCLRLAYEAGRAAGPFPTVLNGANEMAVDAFIKGRIGFIDIPGIVERVLSEAAGLASESLDDILGADAWARERASILMRTDVR